MSGSRRTGKDRKPVAAHALLAAPSFGKLLTQANLHAAILRRLRQQLPGFLADHCLACVAHEDGIVVYTDAAVWATQLRFTLPTALPQLRAGFDGKWQRIQVRILHDSRPDYQETPTRVPGTMAVAEIEAAARDTSSEQIRQALQRLTNTWRMRSR
jgi:hypothetical protein